MRTTLLLAVAALATTGAIAASPKLTPEQELAKITRGALPGKKTNCVSLTLSRDSQTIDGLGIVYRIGRTFYVNRFDGSCPLTRLDTLVTSIPSTQLCRGDTARVFDSAARIPKGSCIYGDFETYERPK